MKIVAQMKLKDSMCVVVNDDIPIGNENYDKRIKGDWNG